MNELTFEEFCGLPLKYCSGMHYEHGAVRNFINEEHNVMVQINTPRNPTTGEWGFGTKTFFLLDDSRAYPSSAHCYLAYMAKVCGEPYECEHQ